MSASSSGKTGSISIPVRKKLQIIPIINTPPDYSDNETVRTPGGASVITQAEDASSGVDEKRGVRILMHGHRSIDCYNNSISEMTIRNILTQKMVKAEDVTIVFLQTNSHFSKLVSKYAMEHNLKLSWINPISLSKKNKGLLKKERGEINRNDILVEIACADCVWVFDFGDEKERYSDNNTLPNCARARGIPIYFFTVPTPYPPPAAKPKNVIQKIRSAIIRPTHQSTTGSMKKSLTTQVLSKQEAKEDEEKNDTSECSKTKSFNGQVVHNDGDRPTRERRVENENVKPKKPLLSLEGIHKVEEEKGIGSLAQTDQCINSRYYFESAFGGGKEKEEKSEKKEELDWGSMGEEKKVRGSLRPSYTFDARLCDQ